MTNEERDLITQFIQRVGGAPPRAGSVPATSRPLPPVDPEADALIADLMQRHPEARYRLAQTAFVQEHALAEAQNTINRLQWELDQARARPAPPLPAPSPWGAAAQPQPRGLFGARPGAPQPPAPVHPPGHQPGMFQRGGSGFLGSALTTAVGVAGGLMVGNMLMNAFSGGGAAQAGAADSSPWTNPAATPDASTHHGSQDTGWQDTGWQDASAHDDADTGWTDADSDLDF